MSQTLTPTSAPFLGPGVPLARRGLLSPDTLGPHAWVALAGGLLASIFIGPSPEAGAWLWAIALLVVGMPHGGYDLDALRRASTPPSWASTIRPFSVYTALMLACVASVVVAPTAMLLAFLLLTIHHFGHADSVWTRDSVRPGILDRCSAWGHGVVVVASPFAFAPSAAWAPFETIARTLGASSSLSASALQLGATIMLVGAAISLCLGTTRLLRTHRSAHAIRQSIVLTLTLALASVAPPLVAVGVYFLAVHALGHCLTASTPPRSNANAPSAANIWRVHTRSLPLLLPSIAIVLGLSGLFVNEPTLINRIALAFLLFCAVATLPHHMLWAGSAILVAPTSSRRRSAIAPYLS